MTNRIFFGGDETLLGQDMLITSSLKLEGTGGEDGGV